jgi:hypothetical protein
MSESNTLLPGGASPQKDLIYKIGLASAFLFLLIVSCLSIVHSFEGKLLNSLLSHFCFFFEATAGYIPLALAIFSLSITRSHQYIFFTLTISI